MKKKETIIRWAIFLIYVAIITIPSVTKILKRNMPFTTLILTWTTLGLIIPCLISTIRNWSLKRWLVYSFISSILAALILTMAMDKSYPVWFLLPTLTCFGIMNLYKGTELLVLALARRFIKTQ